MPESPTPKPATGRIFPIVAEMAPPCPRFTLGAPGLDAALSGGLQRGRLHEVLAAAPADQTSMAGFALMLALRAGGRGGPIVWLAEKRQPDGQLYPPGLAELGADPARLICVTAPDARTLLRAAADVVRSPAAGTAVIAPSGNPALFDLTATRRLTLFAERSGVTVLLLRGPAPEAPSAAGTRWRVASAPSTPLDADAPGPPAFTVDLVRQRGGPPSCGWRLEWDRDAAGFTATPLSGDLAARSGQRRLGAA